MQVISPAVAGPALPYVDPLDVTHDPCLTKAEKRALLASWASDARAIPNAPALRRLETGAIVHIDGIFGALRALDGAEPEVPARTAPPERSRAANRRWRPWSRRFRRGGDDDDGMPPVPMAARPRRPAPLVDAVAVPAA